MELLCKSEVDETTDSDVTITLTQVGTTLVETVPWAWAWAVRRSNRIAQTTVEDAMNLVQRYSNAIHSADISTYTLFYRLLLKLYLEMPAVRPRVLHLLTEKLRALLQTQGPNAPGGALLRLDEVCANGAIQQPVHDLVATVALVLHPAAALPVVLGDRNARDTRGASNTGSAGRAGSAGSAGSAGTGGSVEQMKQELST